MIYAICNPENAAKARAAISEELDLIRKDGVTEDELKKVIASYVQSQRVARTNDASLARLIEKNTDAGRTMAFVEELEAKVSKLTVDEGQRRDPEIYRPATNLRRQRRRLCETEGRIEHEAESSIEVLLWRTN